MLKNKTIKTILTVMGCICLAFAMVNLMWFIRIKWPYDNYKQIVLSQKNTTWEYSMGIDAPDNMYLNFRGFCLNVSDANSVVGHYNHETGENIIEGKGFVAGVKIEYGFFRLRLMLDIMDLVGENDGFVTVNSDLEVLDDGYYPDDEYVVKMQRFIDDNYDYFKDLLNYAMNLWNVKF